MQGGYMKERKNREKRKEASGGIKALFSINEVGVAMPLIVICIVVSIINPDFLGFDNLIDVMRSACFNFIVAVPVTYLLITASLDLSIGAAISLGGIICGKLLAAGIPTSVSILLALLAGAAIGFLKGTIIVKYKLPAFIATLGIQYIINGVISITTSGMPISGLPDNFKQISQERFFDKIPYPVLIAIVIGVIGHIVLAKTKYGRALFAVGGNEETAYLSGINVKKISMSVQILVSVLAIFVGILLASRFSSAQPAAGTGTEMTILAAVIIGGTSMFGGKGTIVGTAIGCLMLAVISNGLVMIKVSSYWQTLIFGFILLFSVALDQYRRSRSGA